jgi:hypothetical protein
MAFTSLVLSHRVSNDPASGLANDLLKSVRRALFVVADCFFIFLVADSSRGGIRGCCCPVARFHGVRG